MKNIVSDYEERCSNREHPGLGVSPLIYVGGTIATSEKEQGNVTNRQALLARPTKRKICLFTNSILHNMNRMLTDFPNSAYSTCETAKLIKLRDDTI